MTHQPHIHTTPYTFPLPPTPPPTHSPPTSWTCEKQTAEFLCIINKEKTRVSGYSLKAGSKGPRKRKKREETKGLKREKLNILTRAQEQRREGFPKDFNGRNNKRIILMQFYFCLLLAQWFSTVNFTPQGTLGKVWRHF